MNVSRTMILIDLLVRDALNWGGHEQACNDHFLWIVYSHK